ncbi:MAG: hypothetical protein AAFO94_01680 [Bacteroidota bacterium]
MKTPTTYVLLLLLSLSACIGDDYIFDTIDEQLIIATPLDSLQVDGSFQLEARFTNNVGEAEERPLSWESLTPEIVSVDDEGWITGLALGLATVEVSTTGEAGLISTQMQFEVTAGETTVGELSRTGTIQTTSSYRLKGSFTLSQVDGDLQLDFADDYEASSALPGLYVYLTNNPSTNANALEIGAVEVFSGEHSYTISDVGIMEYKYLLYYCKPFAVKVGDGEIE